MTSNEKKEIYWYNKAMQWCSRREFCKSEVKTRLLKSELSSEEIATIIKKLIEEKFIDEDRFVRAFVHDKLEFQKWGLLKIKQALFFKGISEESIVEVFKNIDKESYLRKFEEVAKIKWKSIKAVRSEDLKANEKKDKEFEIDQKLLRFLASKGISMEDSYLILKKVKGKK